MFDQAFKNIDDVLRKEAGCASELDYTEQSSWLLFLKYLDALEASRAMEAELEGRQYTYLLDKPYRWETWAAPKTPSTGSGQGGKIDHNAAMTGDDLRDFVNQTLFPYLHRFKEKADHSKTLEYKIGEIFGELKNRIQSGYNLRDIIDHIDELRFNSQAEKHELSHLYEAKIKNMGNAGRNGGEYYTPRPLIRAMVQVVNPQIGETIYDGACGSAGFLCEAFEYLRAGRSLNRDSSNTQPPPTPPFQGESQPAPPLSRGGWEGFKPDGLNGAPTGLTTRELKILQEQTFYGIEKKSLAYVIAIMNMILHGIEAPNIVHANTLGMNLNDVQDKDRFDIVLANPPFGGKERKEVQQNFPIKTGETAFLFLQHFIKFLKAGGRGAVVIKNTFLSNTDNASVSLRKHLLESCNLHTILDMPGGTFQGAGVKTVVLFFEKGSATRNIWYYQLAPSTSSGQARNLGKTNPLNDNDLAEFVELATSRASATEGPVTAKSWNVDVRASDGRSLSSVEADLSVKNPNGGEVVQHRSPQAIMDEIAALDEQSAQVLDNIRLALSSVDGALL